MALKSLMISILSAVYICAAPAAHGAGTLPLAMAQQIDINGQPLAGCLVNFFVAGTVATPQNAYSDFGLTQNPNNVLQCDQTGRVPMFWLADGLIHVRLTDSAGGVVVDTTMQVLGPSSGGGGGGGTVDPTSIMATGDIKARYGTGPLPGFVRCNALTIGNAVSGATERANADTQALFVYLYNIDPNLVVSGGRTGNALNDYNANKILTLPDWRGRVIAGLADMGNTSTTALTAPFFAGTAAPTVLGAAGGNQGFTLQTTHLPPYSPAGTITNGTITPGAITVTNGAITNGAITTTISPSANIQQSSGVVQVANGGSFFSYNNVNLTATSTQAPTTQATTTATMATPSQATSSFIGSAQGGNSAPFPVVSPMMVTTIYMKL